MQAKKEHARTIYRNRLKIITIIMKEKAILWLPDFISGKIPVALHKKASYSESRTRNYKDFFLQQHPQTRKVLCFLRRGNSDKGQGVVLVLVDRGAPRHPGSGIVQGAALHDGVQAVGVGQARRQAA